MLKIGTHNSATGETGKGFLSWLLTPFARCQRKTIREQLDAGCRLFDIRIKNKGGEWAVAHGFWTCKKSLYDILSILNIYALNKGEDVYVRLTSETALSISDDAFLLCVKHIGDVFPHLKIFEVCEKRPEWRSIWRDCSVETESHYLGLTFDKWQSYIPIPWLWKQFYYKKVEFADDCFREVDFL